LRHYEIMVILDGNLEERTVAPSLDTYLNVIRTSGGSVEKLDVWGRRRLSYEINKKTEGIYAVVQLTAEGDTTKELDRQLKLSEAVMRTKVLRAEEAIAQVVEAKKLAEEKAARKAANPKAAAPKAEAPAKAEAKAAAPKAAPAAKPAAAKADAAPKAEAAPKADAADKASDK
jgi:small subunit ribosomal protein S6